MISTCFLYIDLKKALFEILFVEFFIENFIENT